MREKEERREAKRAKRRERERNWNAELYVLYSVVISGRRVHDNDRDGPDADWQQAYDGAA